LEQNKK